jgi:integrase
MFENMASLIRKKDCKFWIACFRDQNRKQHRRSTRETNRRQAQFIADKYELAARGTLTQYKAREVFAELYRRFSGDTIPSSSVEAFARTWLATKLPEVAPHTGNTYEAVVEGFLKYLGALAEKDLVTITRQHLADFRNGLATKLRPATVKMHLTVVKLIFRAAKRDGYIANDPSEFVETVRKTAQNVREAFTIEEIQALLKVADPEWTSMILFGAFCGQRLGDVCALTWANLDLEENVIRLVTGKTGKRLTIPIAAPLRTHIESLPVSDDPLAPLHPRAFRQYVELKQPSVVTCSFARLLKAAGLRSPAECVDLNSPYRKTQYKLSYHSLRHFAVSWLKSQGVPQATVQEFIGHATAEMSSIYTHVGLSSLRQAADRFPDILSPKK